MKETHFKELDPTIKGFASSKLDQHSEKEKWVPWEELNTAFHG